MGGVRGMNKVAKIVGVASVVAVLLFCLASCGNPRLQGLRPEDAAYQFEKAEYQEDLPTIRKLAGKETKEEFENIAKYQEWKKNNKQFETEEFVFQEVKINDSHFYYYIHRPSFPKNYYEVYSNNGRWQVEVIPQFAFTDHTEGLPINDLQGVYIP